MIDWQKEVGACKEGLLEDLKNLLRVNNERDGSEVTPDALFGPGPRDALKHTLAYSERDEFKVKNVDNCVGHINLDEGNKTLGIFGHTDVIPTGGGWDTDPYEPVIKDGKILARGSSDDKSPGMTAYYVMKIIEELDLKLSKKVRFVVGSDEENGWGDTAYYFRHEEEPDFDFSSGAEFPIINGKKRNASLALRFKGDSAGDCVLKSFISELRENVVPGTAIAALQIPSVDTAIVMEGAFYQLIEADPISGTIEVGSTHVKIELAGKGVHGANPQSSINADPFLALPLDNYEFLGSAKQFIHVTAACVREDFYGEKLGVAYEDEKIGKLTMNAGLFTFEENGTEETSFINMNFRFPKGVTVGELRSDIEQAVGQEGTAITQGAHVMEPHYVPMNNPLVATLLQVYEDRTGEKGYEQVIGGGTYGRLLKRDVAYRAMFPGYTDTTRQTNEFMSLNNLFRATAIYVGAIYRLAK